MEGSARGRRIRIYIDGANLHRAAVELGFQIDYRKFRAWLREKYLPTEVFIFIGKVPGRTALYDHLTEAGFRLVFREVVAIRGSVKGNCDAEMVLQVVSDHFTGAFTTCVLITGDGDFGCLVRFLQERKANTTLIAPDRNKCSYLLRNKNVPIVFLNELYHKFAVDMSKTKKKKPPTKP